MSHDIWSVFIGRREWVVLKLSDLLRGNDAVADDKTFAYEMKEVGILNLIPHGYVNGYFNISQNISTFFSGKDNWPGEWKANNIPQTDNELHNISAHEDGPYISETKKKLLFLYTELCTYSKMAKKVP